LNTSSIVTAHGQGKPDYRRSPSLAVVDRLAPLESPPRTVRRSAEAERSL